MLITNQSKVMKKASNLRVPSMSCKAFNGRVVLEYLASVSKLAMSKQSAAGPGRLFGLWLAEEGRLNGPQDPKIPLQARAMFSVRTYFFVPLGIIKQVFNQQLFNNMNPGLLLPGGLALRKGRRDS